MIALRAVYRPFGPDDVCAPQLLGEAPTHYVIEGRGRSRFCFDYQSALRVFCLLAERDT
jgi:hypothetical protein